MKILIMFVISKFRAGGRSGILAQQPASRFCAAAESPSSDEEAYARRYTKTAGCKQDLSGARHKAPKKNNFCFG